MTIDVLTPEGLHHGAGGFHAWEPGRYEFPDDPLYAGWLAGQIQQGKCRHASPSPAPRPRPTPRGESRQGAERPPAPPVAEQPRPPRLPGPGLRASAPANAARIPTAPIVSTDGRPRATKTNPPKKTGTGDGRPTPSPE